MVGLVRRRREAAADCGGLQNWGQSNVGLTCWKLVALETLSGRIFLLRFHTMKKPLEVVAFPVMLRKALDGRSLLQTKCAG